MRSLNCVALTIAGVIFAAPFTNSLRAEVRVQGQAGDVRVEAHGATVAEILAALLRANISADARAEELTLDDFARLHDALR